MALWTRIIAIVAVICGVLAICLIGLYICLRVHVSRQRAAKQAKKSAAKAEGKAPGGRKAEDSDVSAAAPRARRATPSQTTKEESESAPAKPRAKNLAAFERDSEVLKREQELKRDALHIFRRLHASSDRKERADLCKEAVVLFDSLSTRLGATMAALTSGKIIFCNALMECGGLEELQECKDANEANANALIERVVPVIFSS
mmetsp:Transcript_26158/g.61010  ORF Transcript_26158/g.61010 Transcript_26158/m.61010 type:complete len:203 (-) Transcript_26158:93-701(-)